MARTLNAANLAEAQKSTSWIIDFIKVTVDPTSPDKIIKLCSHYEAITVGSDTYQAAGQLLGISKINDDLEAKDTSLTLSLSGVGNTFTSIALTNNIEGSLVEISKGFFDGDTGALVANPDIKWIGRADSFNIVDENNGTDQDTVTISLICKSLLATILGKTNGRFTSISSFQANGSSADMSMEFTPSLADFSPSFGKEEQ